MHIISRLPLASSISKPKISNSIKLLSVGIGVAGVGGTMTGFEVALLPDPACDTARSWMEKELPGVAMDNGIVKVLRPEGMSYQVTPSTEY